MSGKTIKIEPPLTGYRRLMACNRYSIEHIDSFLILHFGLVNSSGILLDRYSCAASKLELEGQKASLMEYLGRAGTLADAPPTWQAPAGVAPSDFCNHIGLAGNAQLAEITLNNFVVRTATAAKENSPIKADGIALLRCPIEVQKHWIRDLFL